MLIERSLLNLLSACRVIRHKSISNRIYAKTSQKVLALNQLSSGEDFRLKQRQETKVASQQKISKDIVQRSIRQENVKRRYFNLFSWKLFSRWHLVHQIREPGAILNRKLSNLVPDPDFPLKMQSNFKDIKRHISEAKRKKPVRHSSFQGAAPDGHKFVLFFLQQLVRKRNHAFCV